MKCTELILQDHRILRRGLNILDRMVQIIEAGDRIEIFDIRIILRFLRMFGDEYHQNMEEKVLFPALLHAAPQEEELHQMLLQEHGEERELVAAIEASLNPKHGIAFVRCSRRLIQLLRDHLDQEENVLCDSAERLLSAQDDNEIASRFIVNPAQSETYACFSRLERKYTPRPRGFPVERDRSAHV